MLASLRNPDRVTIPKPPSRETIERVSAPVRAAIDAMVWQGLPRDAAAKVAGINEHSLYKALRRPPVKALYMAELDVLRTSGRARRFHRLEEIGEQNDNLNAAVNAIKLLDYQEESRASAGDRGATAGFVIQVIAAPGTTIAGKTIDGDVMASHPKADNVDIIE